MKPIIRTLLAAVVALCATQQAALAVPVNYDEAVSGDLSEALPSFVLDVGDNTFTGRTLNFADFSSPPPTFFNDLDRFFFTIQPGQVLTSVVLTVTSLFNNSDSTVSVSMGALTEIRTGVSDLTIVSSETVSLLFDSSPVASLPASLAIPEAGLGLGAGLYRARASREAGTNGPGIRDFGYDYTLTLSVSQLPLPASAWLLLSGLGLLASARAMRAT